MLTTAMQLYRLRLTQYDRLSQQQLSFVYVRVSLPGALHRN